MKEWVRRLKNEYAIISGCRSDQRKRRRYRFILKMSSLITTKSKERNEIILDIQGDFTYVLHRDFREAYRDEPPGFTYIINLFKTEYMDSAALGMLLLLREHAG